MYRGVKSTGIHMNGRVCIQRSWLTILVFFLLIFSFSETVYGRKPDIDSVRKRVKKKKYKFRVGENSATKYSLEQLCGLKIPPAALKAKLSAAPQQTLDDNFDWRQLGGCTEVKDQGGCGSCWAFAAMGVAESQYMIRGPENLDLSEQWLVSCTESGTCDGGWYGQAFGYMISDKDSCNKSGAALELEYPYEADDVDCACPAGDRYVLTNWSSIPGDIESIKQAIATYGPVAVGVAAGDMFQCYVGGIFDANVETDINHAVVLVGWDDTQGENGIWYLRNSWGSGWGEGGYMRIEYDCNKVGTGSMWAELIPENEPNTLSVPDQYPNIKSALEQAGDNDIIILSPGDYTGPDNTDIDFAGKEVTIRSIDPYDPNIVAATVIDCQGSAADQHRAFIFQSGEGPAATLKGLTIRNGYVKDNGGGVYCYYSSPTIKNCNFENNTAAQVLISPKSGGAIALYNSSPIIDGCKFINNSASGGGGGISCRDSSLPIISNCRILDNTAGTEGGGIYCWVNSNADIDHTIIAGNHADHYGGGLSFYECTGANIADANIPEITFSIISDNTTNGYGGGIFILDSMAKIDNSILWNNSGSGPSGSQIAMLDDSFNRTALHVSYCDVTGLDQGHLLEPADSSECVLEWGDGNFQADPLFVDPIARDYHLKSSSGHWDEHTRNWILDDGDNYDENDDENSPCIDAGDPGISVTDEYPCNGGQVNIGVYGNTAQASRSANEKCCMMCIPTDFNCDCQVNLQDLAYMMADWLECNYLPRYHCYN